MCDQASEKKRNISGFKTNYIIYIYLYIYIYIYIYTHVYV